MCACTIFTFLWLHILHRQSSLRGSVDKNESSQRNNGITELISEISQLVWDRLLPLLHSFFLLFMHDVFCTVAKESFFFSFLFVCNVIQSKFYFPPCSCGCGATHSWFLAFAHIGSRVVKQQSLKHLIRASDFRFLQSVQSVCHIQRTLVC